MVTDSQVAYYISMFIVFVVATSFSIGWAKADGIKPITDKFDLGYIEDRPLEVLEPRKSTIKVKQVEEHDELKDLERQVKIAKLKKQLHDLNNPESPKESKPSKSPIFDDCVSALTALGSPARKAKAEAQVIFDRNPNIKTVQEFITEYGKR